MTRVEYGNLPIRATLTLAQLAEAMPHLVATYGPQREVKVSLQAWRTICISRDQVLDALRQRDCRMVVCVQLECPRVGEVFEVPCDQELSHDASRLHRERACASVPLPSVGEDLFDAELWLESVLDTLNYPTGDSSYTPDATWTYCPPLSPLM